MAALIETLAPPRSAGTVSSFDGWVGLWGLDGLASMLQTTMPREQETSDGTFTGLVMGAYLRNSVVFSSLAIRARLFSEARFAFQQLNNSRPGKLFGTPALRLLERPEPGKTTRDLLQTAILDADLGGNGFNLGRTDAIRRLRPDWMAIAYGSKRRASELGSWDPDAEVIGYGYYPGGYASGEDVLVYMPEEISHFAPTKDPLARNRGISLLTAGLREILADNSATTHKLSFFSNAATPNLALKFPPGMTKDRALEWIELFEQEHRGATKGFRTLFLGSGVEPVPVGLGFGESGMDYAKIQGKAETRIAALTGMHPVVVALSEGLQGSSLNAGNFGSAARLVADATLRPLWGDMAGSLETIVPPPSPGTRLWTDDRDIAFLRQDVGDQADINQKNAQTIGQLVKDGFTAASAVTYIVSGGDASLLVHTGLTSVQLQPPLDQPAAAYRATRQFWSIDVPYASMGTIAAGAVVPGGHPILAAYPSLFEPVVDQLLLPARASGPAQIVTREQVMAKRLELLRLGQPAGHNSIARALSVSSDTVRRRLRDRD
jgi:phage portal protein BeeE